MLIGKKISNRYKIIKQLSQDFSGYTYLAEDEYLPDNLLLKVQQIKPSSLESEVLQAAREIFNNEAKILYRLGNNHPQIPNLLARFEEDGQFYLIHEFTPGKDLDQQLIPGKRFNEDEVVKILRDILEVLKFVHENQLIHGDIQPKNLLRRRQNNNIILLEFGAIKQISNLTIDNQGNISFKTNQNNSIYLPPTQLGGKPEATSDIYAVGLIAIQALTGLTPQQITADHQNGQLNWLNQTHISSSLADILIAMVASQGSDIYQNATEAWQDLMANCVPRHVTNSNHVYFAIKPQFEDVFVFADGLAPVEIGGQWGYINREGNFVIPPQFNEAYRFSEELAPVKQGKHYGYIDKRGEFIIPPKFDDAYWFTDGMARVQKDKMWGYIDSTGNYAIPLQFNDAYWFNNGLAPVRQYKQYGFINRQGKFVIPAQFDGPGWFYEGLLSVQEKKYFDKKWGYIDQNGEFVIPPKFDEAYRFSEGLAPVKIENLYGYINKSGDLVIPPKFNDAYWYHNGIARAQQGNRWGYIDKNGDFMISPKFNQAYWFTEGLARVRQGDKWGYINTAGDWVVQPQFDGTAPFFEGMAAVRVGNLWGFIDNPLGEK